MAGSYELVKFFKRKRQYFPWLYIVYELHHVTDLGHKKYPSFPPVYVNPAVLKYMKERGYNVKITKADMVELIVSKWKKSDIAQFELFNCNVIKVKEPDPIQPSPLPTIEI